MIAPEKLYMHFRKNDISFFTGVPDSLLKDFLKFLQDHSTAQEHIITANEGLAVGLASGYHFSTGKLPLVYLQNSGLGNLVNPLTSLADKEMYSVPMLLLIGWRGRPGTKDEPQHSKMGRITIPMLDVLEVPVYLLDESEVSSFEKITKAADQSMKEQRPVALLAPEQIFEKYKGDTETDKYPLVREEVIKRIIEKMNGDETVVCTTGKIGREFYEQNLAAGNKVKKYLLSAGAMGHANHIALGIKMQIGEKTIMLDGDAAVLMHMGSLPTVAAKAGNNFIHIVLNNGSHESVGGQPTQAFFTDLCAVAKASGYKQIFCITKDDELELWLKNDLQDNSTQFVEIRINRKSRNEPGRPKGHPTDWKNDYMRQISSIK
jgi:phosphonopyruvate decarboxylase